MRLRRPVPYEKWIQIPIRSYRDHREAVQWLKTYESVGMYWRDTQNWTQNWIKPVAFELEVDAIIYKLKFG